MLSKKPARLACNPISEIQIIKQKFQNADCSERLSTVSLKFVMKMRMKAMIKLYLWVCLKYQKRQF